MPVHHMNPDKAGLNRVLQIGVPELVGITVAPEDLLFAIDVPGILPLGSIQAVRDHEVGDPFVNITPALGDDPGDGGPDSEINQQPLILRC